MAGTRIGLVQSQWQGQFEGQLLMPADDGYDASRRIWNGMIDRKPTLIARCASPNDVRAAVKLARTEQMPVSVRGGGHGVAGTAVCDGGIVIDLGTVSEKVSRS